MFLDVLLSIIQEGDKVQGSKGTSQKDLIFKVSYALKFICKRLRCCSPPRLQLRSSTFPAVGFPSLKPGKQTSLFCAKKAPFPPWYAVRANRFHPERPFSSRERTEAPTPLEAARMCRYARCTGKRVHGDRWASDSSHRWVRTGSQVCPLRFMTRGQGRKVGL